MPRVWSYDEVMRALTWTDAVEALASALRDGFDPEDDPDRVRTHAEAGDLLVMPSASERMLGAKLLTIRTGSPEQGVPSIQGVYVLFEGTSLSPIAVLDGAALTGRRTPAVSALAARHLAARPLRRLAVFGTGVQALGHALALAETAGVNHVDVIGRTPDKVRAMVKRLVDDGISAAPAGPGAVPTADMIACTTSAGFPLFDGNQVADGTVVLAVGSHTTATRDVDSSLVKRSSVVVESRRSARREAGAVVIPRLDVDRLTTLRELVTGRDLPRPEGPRVFVGTGMSWEDLVVATAVVKNAE
ncbi:MAG TPA: ornithine cyclodeaminase family protein [Amycolatopsis sp.]|uniref:ornithine cyclodeaminase family protein n=1 Tax=Amycolatopsis sp. TaxID=37632 RepID=UPI002B46369E|nr:ornithine cyclodeaminase family protein [Amycolatopsis sp.]HKS45026.1 ornithine cyclodeaminase family protein [Amycolatopsis sp.]